MDGLGLRRLLALGCRAMLNACRSPKYSRSFLKHHEKARMERLPMQGAFATLVTLVLMIYVIVFWGIDNPILLFFRINNFITLFLVVFVWRISLFERAREYAEILIFVTVCHFLFLQSLTYSRLKNMTGPLYKNIHIESHEPSEEVGCILISYVVVALVAHLELVSLNIGFLISCAAPLIWTVQAALLGTCFPEISKIAVMYFIASFVAYLDLRKHRRVSLASQWELLACNFNHQHAAMSSIMDRLCDCVVSLNSRYEVMYPCPRLAALTFKEQTLEGTFFPDLIATESDKQMFETAMLNAQSEDDMLGSVHGCALSTTCLKDSRGREIKVHCYHSRYFDAQGQPCFMLGLVEHQESEDCEGSFPVQSFAQLHRGPSDSSTDAGDDVAETRETATTLLTNSTPVCTSTEDMSITINTDSCLSIVDYSDSLAEFVDAARLGGLSLRKAAKLSAKYLSKLRNLRELVLSLNELQREFILSLPRSRQILKAESCSLEFLCYYPGQTDLENAEEISEPTVLATVNLVGRKEIIEPHSSPCMVVKSPSVVPRWETQIRLAL
eukprot:TRINITY_DN41279_c0_g1_i1.p1 TRINITY_DN41279_c0_g1~~TRINITY_DN41279_c0_g1_i1.p1  ORF type:complete len:556 (+),score=74.97 TRINITY_DN41279_c0_g1_i1:67-1734(+)